MKHSLKVGFSFGSTSGIITTLGLMVGLHSGTHSKLVILGAVLTIAIADAFSDALGIHLSEESENIHTTKQIWEASLFTFLTKFFITLTFIVPLLLFSLVDAIIISICWGLFLLSIFSFLNAKKKNIERFRAVVEHLVVAVIVIITTHYIGDFVSAVCK